MIVLAFVLWQNSQAVHYSLLLLWNNISSIKFSNLQLSIFPLSFSTALVYFSPTLEIMPYWRFLKIVSSADKQDYSPKGVS